MFYDGEGVKLSRKIMRHVETLNLRASKYMNKNWLNWTKEKQTNSQFGLDFKHSCHCKWEGGKNSKDKDINSAVNQANIYRTHFFLVHMNIREDHILDHKTNVKCRRFEIIVNTFSDHNRFKLEINNRKISGKSLIIRG